MTIHIVTLITIKQKKNRSNSIPWWLTWFTWKFATMS